MEPERWRQIETLYHSALERHERERAAFLEDACGGDQELHREVESLLACQAAAADFIEVPAIKAAAAAVAQDQQTAVRPVEQSLDIIGHTFSHYRVLKKLGGGGMGVVYTAEDVRLGRVVALKFLPEPVTRDRGALDRFQREARAASSLNHANICTVFDIGEEEGRPFIVMELLEGQTLKHRIQGKPIPRNETIDFGIEIASALEAAHAKGIIHRDIKPANIFITDHGQAKILDFGLAKLASQAEPIDLTSAATAAMLLGENTLTRPGMAIGTLSYMSPEQARGQPVDARSDLFSFGAVLYEMATGRRAFPKWSDWTPPPATADIDGELYRIVLRLLEPDLERRYQTATDVLSDLKRLQQRV